MVKQLTTVGVEKNYKASSGDDEIICLNPIDLHLQLFFVIEIQNEPRKKPSYFHLLSIILVG